MHHHRLQPDLQVPQALREQQAQQVLQEQPVQTAAMAFIAGTLMATGQMMPLKI
jgi:hypothetical protein